MRFPTIAIVCCFLSFAASAQFKKGDRMLGTSFLTGSFTSGTTETNITQRNKNLDITITPMAGIFISERTVVGASVLLRYQQQKLSNTFSGTIYRKDNYKVFDGGLGVFARQYFKGGGSILPFAHAFLNGGAGKVNTDGVHYYNAGGAAIKENYKGHSEGRMFFNTGLHAGITKMIGSHAGIDAFVGYNFSATGFTTVTDGSKFNQSTSMPIETYHTEIKQTYNAHAVVFGVGVQVFLGKRGS